MHSTIGSTVHSMPLNNLEHCICTATMTNIRPARNSNLVPPGYKPQSIRMNHRGRPIGHGVRIYDGVRMGDRAWCIKTYDGVRVGVMAWYIRTYDGVRVGDRAWCIRTYDGVRIGDRAWCIRTYDGVRMGVMAWCIRTDDDVRVG